MIKNEWRSTFKTEFAQWSIIFPNYENEEDAEKSFFAAQQILNLGQKYQVYHLLETSDGFSYNPDPKQSYVEFMRENYREKDYIPFFSTRIKPNRASSVIAYYENSEIVESEIANMGDLLKRLHPDDIPQSGTNLRNFAPVSPITLSGMELHLGKHQFRKPTLFIQLQTTIWFPQIYGRLSGEKVDNSELANRHTPRLNNFLTDLSEFAKSLDLVWRCDKDLLEGDYYKPWLDETGIILDKE